MNYKRKTGFTLIEFLLALTIFSILIVSVYSVFQNGLMAYRSTDSLTEKIRQARWITSDLSKEISNTVIFPGAGFEGDASSLSFFTILPYFNDDTIQVSRIYRIDYKLVKSEDELTVRLIKSTTDMLNQRSDTSITQGFFKEFTFSFSSGEKEDGWTNSWSGSDSLPNLVRFEAIVGDTLNEREDFSFTQIIPVLSQSKI